ncbi:MAG: hypothetical protein ACQKBT_09500, partial [Puniceicoccales bacterium]
MKRATDRIQSIHLLRYLKLSGWSVRRSKKKEVLFFDSPENEDGFYQTILIPEDESFEDSYTRFQEAIEQIAYFEGVESKVIFDKIRLWNIDLLKTKLDDPIGSISSIPLNMANGMIKGLKDFISACAYVEFEPRKYYGRLGNAGTEFAKDCNFGHTFKGSFGLTVESPIRGIEQLGLDNTLQEVPFARKVMERIVSGYDSIDSAREADDADILIGNYEDGFNGNVLDELADLYESADGLKLSFGFNWSPEIAPPVKMTGREYVFDRRSYELARFVAKRLSESDDQSIIVVKSYVVSLKSDQPPFEDAQELLEHVITLDWEKERGVFVKIRLPLPAIEYRKACDAHKEGRKIIVEGLPEKQGKYWYLTRASEI